MQTQPGEGILDRVRHLFHQQFVDQVCPRCNLADSFLPIGGGNRLDRDRGRVDRFFIDAKVRVDRTAPPGRTCAVSQRVIEDAPSTRVGPPTSEAGRIGKVFQGRDKALAPPGAAELCHCPYSRTAPRRSAIKSLNVSLSSSVSQDSSALRTTEEPLFLPCIVESGRSSIVPL